MKQLVMLLLAAIIITLALALSAHHALAFDSPVSPLPPPWRPTPDLQSVSGVNEAPARAEMEGLPGEVPEPATLLLVIAGLGGVVLWTHRNWRG